jgi:dihydrolipoamide dehydrogenase
MNYDMTVIGSGPGGYVAAIRAAQLGLTTAVVEMAPVLGGTCLHVGCIPTTAMLHAAAAMDSAKEASRLGVQVGDVSVDLVGVQRYKTKTVRSNTKGIELLFRKNGIELINGRATLAAPGTLQVTPADAEPFTVDSKHIILATGSTVRELPGIPFDGQRIISSDDALALDSVPESLIVLGAGAVGVEFASMYASFGADVTLVELLPRVLPLEDADISAELHNALERRGITIHTNTRVDNVEATDTDVRIKASTDGDPLDLQAQTLLVAVGRAPVTANLGLDALGVQLDGGFVPVDENMRTTQPGLYAVGDIVNTPALAHVASHEGIVAVEHAAGADPHPINYDKVPACTYCRPEVASIGLTEEAARERGLAIRIGKFPFAASGKAKVLNDIGGFVKVVVDEKYDELLGVHIIGPQATELIGEASAAMELEASATSLFQAIHAHPTLAESLGEAALAAHGRAIHF